MPDVFTPSKRSEVMSRIRSKDTTPEIAVRKSLHSRGFRYRLHVTSLPGKPDIVLPKYRTVIQVRGCFWHGHACEVDHEPKSNKEYWGPKIARNIKRDAQNDQQLVELGWHVEVVWECTCRNKRQFTARLEALERALRARVP